MGESGWERGLIFGLIHLRSPEFIGIQTAEESQAVNANDIRRTVIQTPENRKVGGSTALVATASHCHSVGSLFVLDCGDDL